MRTTSKAKNAALAEGGHPSRGVRDQADVVGPASWSSVTSWFSVTRRGDFRADDVTGAKEAGAKFAD